MLDELFSRATEFAGQATKAAGARSAEQETVLGHKAVNLHRAKLATTTSPNVSGGVTAQDTCGPDITYN